MANQLVFFSGYDSSLGNGLWVSDGTAAGTSEVGGIKDAGVNGVFGSGLLPFDLTAFGDGVLFAGYNSAGAIGLWVSDGTAAGTHELTGINGANANGLNPIGTFTVFNGQVLFDGNNSAGHFGLWVTNGTAAGTHEITGISGASANGLVPIDMTVFGTEVVFNGTNTANSAGLWVTDGTSAGTHELTGINGVNAGGLAPSNLTVFGSELLFNGNDTAGNRGLWVSDGTAAGTHELTGINGTFAGNAGFNPSGFQVVNGKVMMLAVDSAGDNSLWISDGTAAGTSEIGSTGNAGISGAFTGAGGLNPADLTTFGNQVLFSGYDTAGHNGLWISDGTAAGTHELTSISGANASGLAPSDLTVFNGEILFNGSNAAGNRGLWVTDGTAAGTHEVTGINGAYANGISPGSLTSVTLLTPIESFGSTSLVHTDNDYFLYANGTTNGPELTYLGAPWTDGTFGAWTPIGVEATATGYEVAFKFGTANTYTVWTTDSNGNLGTNPIGTVTGSSLSLQALETSFHQDLNGDHVIGLPPGDTAIEAIGSTSLIQVGSNFVFDKSGGGAQMQYDGTAFVAGQFGAWTPIAVEATATGYEVAFRLGSTNSYTVWDTDAHGNIILDPIGTVSGNDPSLIAFEKSFQQDLNGDGLIGNPAIPITIEAFGSTSLVLLHNDYFLDAKGTSNGPELQYGGVAWTDGTFGGWTPIGVETTANGYEVAFNLGGTNQYTVWNTDTNGNITTDSIGSVTANSAALIGLETSFHQDLNGDGIIGDPSVPFTIESFGSTSLTQLGHDFFLYANGTSNGPELKYAGAPWTIGVWGGWTPIGTEATATGYEVAFKLTGADQYTVWNTDTNGNITSNPVTSVPGNNASLQSIETSFHQDLNGDGTIGPPSGTSAAAATAPITAPTSGNAVLTGTAASDTFVFNAHFGNDTVAGFQPGVDQVDLDHTLFASIADLLTHTTDNAAGSAVVTVSADQSITFNDVSKAMLQQHVNDFHLV